MIVTCDTSPLLVLAKTGRLELLETLYDEVWIPSAVLEEVQDPDRSDTKAIRRWCRNESSVSIHAVAEAVRKSIPEELGSGERAAITLAVARDADLVILDDQEGRRAVDQRGLLRATPSRIWRIVARVDGDGTSRRDYTFVDDIVNGGVKSLHRAKLVDAAQGPHFGHCRRDGHHAGDQTIA